MATKTIDRIRQTGLTAKFTGGLSERRVAIYASRYFGIPLKEILIEALTPDASTRKYYRIMTAGNTVDTFIISLYPTPFNQHENSFIDTTRLFERANLPVPKIVDTADIEGIILQEDLGDCSFSEWLCRAKGRSNDNGSMLENAIYLIARIQSATDLAKETGSIAGRHAFDSDKLSWELEYFFVHFFSSLKEKRFAPSKEEELKRDLGAVASELAARPRVLTHRDYHGMNLMVDGRGDLRIIDHQDARLGPVTYDLVPLLLERRMHPADESWVDAQLEYFLEARSKLGLPKIKWDELRYEFDLMTIQRQLKAIGTFSYQTAVVGRGEAYENYIPPAIETVLRAMRKPGMKEYPALREALEICG
jgi:N-acetylmuramate 1-kinase